VAANAHDLSDLAFLYHGADDYLGHVLAFVRAGLAGSEPVFVVLPDGLGRQLANLFAQPETPPPAALPPARQRECYWRFGRAVGQRERLGSWIWLVCARTAATLRSRWR
jgi:hypothetical protein